MNVTPRQMALYVYLFIVGSVNVKRPVSVCTGLILGLRPANERRRYK